MANPNLDPETETKTFISFSEDETEEVAEIPRSEGLVGQTINNYAIIDKIGEGAMAVVYKARQNSTGRIVAVKTLKYADPDLAERFSREVRIHSKLKHDNIVEAIDCIMASNGTSYFVMEYLNGTSLEQHIETKGRFTNPTDIANILSQICEALDLAHHQGVIHRDVKPENIILVDRGGKPHVKVLDFGVAKIQEDLQRLTKTGVVLGSPAYMSPEQCMGLELDLRSDLYSLGVVAYEMVTGDLPFDAETPVDMMEAHCDPNIKPTPITDYRSDLPAIHELQAVFDHVLQTDADKRPQSIDDFKRELALWYKVATVGMPDLPTPFKPSTHPRKLPASTRPREKKESILNTMEAKSLDSLVAKHRPQGQTDSFILPSEMRPDAENKKKTILGGWAALVGLVVGLSLLMAYFLISALEQEPKPNTATQAPAPPATATSTTTSSTTSTETPTTSPSQNDTTSSTNNSWMFDPTKKSRPATEAEQQAAQTKVNINAGSQEVRKRRRLN